MKSTIGSTSKSEKSSKFGSNLLKQQANGHHHPWDKSIKDMYSDNYRFAHNSVTNPSYQTTKESPKDRIRFTVIGNRVSKEFIYCKNIVKRMHKYRAKVYDPPVIKAVTGVEWPATLNDLKRKYGTNVYCTKKQVAVLFNDDYFGTDEELKKFIESRYVDNFELDYGKLAAEEFIGYVRSAGQRPFAYMHITINDNEIGSLIFMLYADVVPNTCENFLRLCTTKRGGYSGSPIHRIVKDGWVQCGGFRLKKSDLGCENFIVPHDRRGVLAMCNDGRHVDCSTQFFILLQPAQWMAHKYVAFGQLVDGENTLKLIESVPTMYESPTESILICGSGILNLDCKDIRINKSILYYLDRHVEDLVAAGQFFYETILKRVWVQIARSPKREEVPIVQSTDSDSGASSKKNSPKTPTSRDQSPAASAHLPKEYYEPEEEPLPEIPRPLIAPLLPEVVKPYYLPYTDVSYPDERDSTYDLKKFLQGDYCLYNDLEVDLPKDERQKEKIIINYSNIPSDMFLFDDNNQNIDTDEMDSDEEQAIQNYLKNNVDRVSFAGGIIRNIGKGTAMFNLFEGTRKSELISFTEMDMKRLRRISVFDRRQSMASSRKSEMVTLNDEDLRRLKQVSAFERRQSTVGRKSQLPALDDDHLKKLRGISAFDKKDEPTPDDDEKHTFAETKALKIPTEEVKPFSFPPIKRQDSQESQESQESVKEKDSKSESFTKEPTFAFAPKQRHKDTDDDDEDIPLPGLPAVYLPPPDELNRTPSKLMRRPTGFLRPDEIKRILKAQNRYGEDEEDEEDEDEVPPAITPAPKEGDDADDADDDEPPELPMGKDARKRFSVKPPEGVLADELNRTPSKLMRRPTGFIKADEIKRILQAQNKWDEDEEDEINQPDKTTKVSPTASDVPSATSMEYVRTTRRKTVIAEDMNVVKTYQRDKQGSSSSSEDEKRQSRALPTLLEKISEEGPTEMQKEYAKDKDLEKAEIKQDGPDKKVTDKVDEGVATDKVDDGDKVDQGDIVGQGDEVDQVDVEPVAEIESSADAVKKGRLRRSTADDSAMRESVIRRLFEDAKLVQDDDDEPPTLKNYTPISERIPMNLMLTFGKRKLVTTESKGELRKSHLRHSITINDTFDEVAEVQYGHRVSAKISLDYVQRLHQIEDEPVEVSFRSMEYASRRPCISVADYIRKNKERLEAIKQQEQQKRE